MLLLAVDTSTSNGSVALAEGDDVLAEVGLAREQGHSTTLLPAVESLLTSAGRRPTDVDVWAVAVGPGTFTGLRVGISTVQGLALASERPCVGVSTLEALAAGVAGGVPVVALMNAFRQEVYAQVFDSLGAAVAAPVVGPLEALLPGFPDAAAFVGDAVPDGRAAIEARCRGASFPSRGPLLAAEVARLGWREAAAGRTQPGEALRPLYLREAQVRRSKTT